MTPQEKLDDPQYILQALSVWMALFVKEALQKVADSQPHVAARLCEIANSTGDEFLVVQAKIAGGVAHYELLAKLDGHEFPVAVISVDPNDPVVGLAH